MSKEHHSSQRYHNEPHSDKMIHERLEKAKEERKELLENTRDAFEKTKETRTGKKSKSIALT